MGLYIELKPQLYYFLTQLENYNEGPFNREIKGHGFSVGFVFKEVCEEFNVRVIPGIEQCLSGGDKSAKGKTLKGFFSVMLNKSVRSGTRSFSEQYSSHNNFSIPMIRDELYRVMKRMEALDQEMATAGKPDLKKNKSKHDKLGYLNAVEWYKLGINNSTMFKSLKEKLDKKV